MFETRYYLLDVSGQLYWTGQDFSYDYTLALPLTRDEIEGAALYAQTRIPAPYRILEILISL
jgi:hypothetical protein